MVGVLAGDEKCSVNNDNRLEMKNELEQFPSFHICLRPSYAFNPFKA
jgi:hypothetical protein